MKTDENLLHRIEDYIFSHYVAGEQIATESELAEMFGVSRSTMREKLSVLVTLGLITRNTSGSFVSENISECLTVPFHIILNMQKSNLNTILEVRNILELNAFAIAINHITDEDIAKMKFVQWKLQNPEYHANEFVENDFEFHHIIATCTGNSILCELSSSVRRVIIESSEEQHRANADPVIRKQTCDSHNRIITALEHRDLEEGLRAMKQHLEDCNRVFGMDPTNVFITL